MSANPPPAATTVAVDQLIARADHLIARCDDPDESKPPLDDLLDTALVLLRHLARQMTVEAPARPPKRRPIPPRSAAGDAPDTDTGAGFAAAELVDTDTGAGFAVADLVDTGAGFAADAGDAGLPADPPEAPPAA